MKLFRAAEVVISPFMEGIARNFDHVRSIEKPQIFAFRLNLRFLLSFAEREGFTVLLQYRTNSNLFRSTCPNLAH
jgi:hypothetical protein